MKKLYDLMEDVTALIVDDDAYAQSYVEQFLVITGISSIRMAQDGREALDILNGDNIDLMFLDISMGSMNGLELLKRIRLGETQTRRDLPVIVLSNASDERLVGTALALDCNAFLNKPSSQAEIEEKIMMIFSSPATIRSPKAYRVISADLSLRMAPTKPQNDYVPNSAAVLRLDELKPGHVLARDIYTVRGNTLLTAGTSLTQALIYRLGELSDLAGLDLVAIEDNVDKQN